MHLRSPVCGIEGQAKERFGALENAPLLPPDTMNFLEPLQSPSVFCSYLLAACFASPVNQSLHSYSRRTPQRVLPRTRYLLYLYRMDICFLASDDIENVCFLVLILQIVRTGHADWCTILHVHHNNPLEVDTDEITSTRLY